MNYKNIFFGLSVIFCLPIFALLGSAKAEHFQFLSNLSHDNIRRNSIHFIAWNVGTYLHKAVMEEDLKKVLEVLKINLISLMREGLTVKQLFMKRHV